MSSNILEKVTDYLVKASEKDIRPEEVTLKTSLRDDLDFDSMQSVTMIMELEDEYGISIDNDELSELNTVDDLIRVIQAKLEASEKVNT